MVASPRLASSPGTAHEKFAKLETLLAFVNWAVSMLARGYTVGTDLISMPVLDHLTCRSVLGTRRRPTNFRATIGLPVVRSEAYWYQTAFKALVSPCVQLPTNLDASMTGSLGNRSDLNARPRSFYVRFFEFGPRDSWASTASGTDSVTRGISFICGSVHEFPA